MDGDNELLDDSEFFDQLLDVFLIWGSRSLFGKIFNHIYPLHMLSSYSMTVKYIVFIACMQHLKVSTYYSNRWDFLTILLVWL